MAEGGKEADRRTGEDRRRDDSRKSAMQVESRQRATAGKEIGVREIGGPKLIL
jgi:hypothetical protein